MEKPLPRRLAGIADLIEMTADLVEECKVQHPRAEVMNGRVLGRLLRNIEADLVEISIEVGRA